MSCGGPARDQSPPASFSTVPDTPPVFFGGGDCDGEGPLVRWRVDNRDIEDHDVSIEARGEVVATASIASGSSGSGTFTLDPGPNEPLRFAARWVDRPELETDLLFRPSLCAEGYETPARGPKFIAAASCVNGVANVEWQLENSSASEQRMSITATDDENQSEAVLWPGDDESVTAAPGADLDGAAPIPDVFEVGAEVRIRAWWRTGDPNTHSRVAVFAPAC